MQAPSPTQAIPSHARTSSMTGYQNSTSFSTETPLGSAATNINLVGCDVPPATTGLPRFRKAVTVVPEGIEVRSHHCSIFSEYSYGKDIGHVERPVRASRSMLHRILNPISRQCMSSLRWFFIQ